MQTATGKSEALLLGYHVYIGSGMFFRNNSICVLNLTRVIHLAIMFLFCAIRSVVRSRRNKGRQEQQGQDPQATGVCIFPSKLF